MKLELRNNNGQSAGKYWCFLSYRHADNQAEGRQWATWLHQALERYEIPRDLIGTRNERGELIPERIYPVFRDEEELSTGNLAAKIQEALQQTRVLVVLCSPRVVSSDYVGNEIRYFRELRSEHAIHCVIIDGDPGAPDSSAANCFHAELRRVGGNGIEDAYAPDLLAADFRLEDGAQGWTTPEAYRTALKTDAQNHGKAAIDQLVVNYNSRLELQLLKLISGILGVPLGELKKRDRLYQLEIERRKSTTLKKWLTAVASLLVLVIGFAIVSYYQFDRRQADARIASATQDLAFNAAVFDEDPVNSLRQSLESLAILENEKAANLESAYRQVATLFRTSRWARIGNNVRRVYPVQAGDQIFTEESNNELTQVRLSDLSVSSSIANLVAISPPWGPNNFWRTIETTDAFEILDMRNGLAAPQPIPQVAEFTYPYSEEHWRALAAYNNPWALCSIAFASCYITSVDDETEWAAVDSYVEELNFSTGEAGFIDDIYELRANDNQSVPCQATRENGDWFLTTKEKKISIEGEHYLESVTFSAGGRYAIVRFDDHTDIYACETGDIKYQNANSSGPLHVQFAGDEESVILVSKTDIEIRDASEFALIATEKMALEGEIEVAPAGKMPMTWKIVGAAQDFILTVLDNGEILHVSDLDPGRRLALDESRTGSFISLQDKFQFNLNSTQHYFSNSTDAPFMVTLDDYLDYTGTVDGIGLVAIRDITNPENILQRFEKPNIDYGDSSIAFDHNAFFGFVSIYSKVDTIDPPFESYYSSETIVFDWQTGLVIAQLPFNYHQNQLSKDPQSQLTIVSGSSYEQDNMYAVFDNNKGTLVWQSEDDAPEIVAIHSGDATASAHFVVEYKGAPASVHRTVDGVKVAELSGQAVSVQFHADSSNYLIARYLDGHSELWRIDDAQGVLLLDIGLIVKQVEFVPNSDQFLVVHDDGRTYLYSKSWLERVTDNHFTDQELIELVRSDSDGIAATAWW